MIAFVRSNGAFRNKYGRGAGNMLTNLLLLLERNTNMIVILGSKTGLVLDVSQPPGALPILAQGATRGAQPSLQVGLSLNLLCTSSVAAVAVLVDSALTRLRPD